MQGGVPEAGDGFLAWRWNQFLAGADFGDPRPPGRLETAWQQPLGRPRGAPTRTDRLLGRAPAVEQGGKRFMLRPQAPGCAGGVFKAAGVALPPLVQQLPNATPPPGAASVPPPRHRGRPRRGATRR